MDYITITRYSAIKVCGVIFPAAAARQVSFYRARMRGDFISGADKGICLHVMSAQLLNVMSHGVVPVRAREAGKNVFGRIQANICIQTPECSRSCVCAARAR